MTASMSPGTTGDFEVPLALCPACGASLDHAMNTTDESRPVAGDLTVCFYCARVLVFEPDGGLRRPTQSEDQRFASDSAVSHVVSLVKREGPRSPGGVR